MLEQIKVFLISIMLSSDEYHQISQMDLKQLTCLAHGVYYEAAVEPIEGKLAVANVVLNRTKHEEFPSTICGVLQEKGQFSFQSNIKKIDLKDKKVEAQVLDAIDVSIKVMNGNAHDNTDGALFFANLRTSTNRTWIEKMTSTMKRTIKISNHSFYRKKARKKKG